jgi:Ca2+/H+ antiporter
MDLAIQFSLGKSILTAPVVAPVLVIVGWMMGIKDMNLLFDGFSGLCNVSTRFTNYTEVHLGWKIRLVRWSVLLGSF